MSFFKVICFTIALKILELHEKNSTMEKKKDTRSYFSKVILEMKE